MIWWKWLQEKIDGIGEPEEIEEDLPLPARRPTTCVDAELTAAPAEPVSPMQQAVLDAGLLEVPGAPVPAFQSNQGTVFLASPQDIARMELMDSVSASISRGPVKFHTNAEIDRLMKEEDL